MNDTAQQQTDDRPRFDAGWYPDLTNDEYHASSGFSSSQVKKLLSQTPAHLRASFSLANEPSPQMRLGTAVHTLVLEPDKFDAEIAVEPKLNKRTKAGKAEAEAFAADAAGKTIITPEQAEQAHYMADSVMSHPVAGVLFSDGRAEQSVYFWYDSTDPDDDSRYRTMCKVRPDWLCDAYPVIVDLKTAADATYSGFQKAVQNFGYHVSAAMYLQGVNQAKDLLSHMGHFAYNKFVFVVVEPQPPYACAVYEMSADYLEIGKTLFRRAMLELQRGIDKNWPGFPEDIRVLDPPPWANRAHII